MLRTSLAAVFLAALSMLIYARPVFADIHFRGHVQAIDKKSMTATVSFFGNPTTIQGMSLYAYDSYGNVVSRLSLIDRSLGKVRAAVSSGFDGLVCGTYITSISLSNKGQPIASRHNYHVRVRYQSGEQSYNVYVDQTIELDRFVSFVWEDEDHYMVDTASILEFNLKSDAKGLQLLGLKLNDPSDSMVDRTVTFSQNSETIKPQWHVRLIQGLQDLEVLVENQFRFTYKDIEAVEIIEESGPVTIEDTVDGLLIPEHKIQIAREQSLGQLETSALQTEEVITAYPVVFRFDQYRRALGIIMEKINKEVKLPLPNIDHIRFYKKALKSLETMTDRDVLNVWLHIKESTPTRSTTSSDRVKAGTLSDEDSSPEPVMLDKVGNVWQKRVNLTQGSYQYHFEIELKTQPCNISLIVPDPLNESGIFRVKSRRVPIQVRELSKQSRRKSSGN